MKLKEMIEKIFKDGATQREISRECRCDDAVIHRLRTGKQETTMYITGKNIEQMARRRGIKCDG